jgi:hypothetical protein
MVCRHYRIRGRVQASDIATLHGVLRSDSEFAVMSGIFLMATLKCTQRRASKRCRNFARSWNVDRLRRV